MRDKQEQSDADIRRSEEHDEFMLSNSHLALPLLTEMMKQEYPISSCRIFGAFETSKYYSDDEADVDMFNMGLMALIDWKSDEIDDLEKPFPEDKISCCLLYTSPSPRD